MSYVGKIRITDVRLGVCWLGLMATFLGLSATSAEDLPRIEGAAHRGEWGQPSPLPLPSLIGTERYEALLFPFLQERKYRGLGLDA